MRAPHNWLATARLNVPRAPIRSGASFTVAGIGTTDSGRCTGVRKSERVERHRLFGELRYNSRFHWVSRTTIQAWRDRALGSGKLLFIDF